MKGIVVIPTYNEKDNIPPLIEAILAQGLDFGIIIVDDNSPDGTGEAAEQISKKHPEVMLIHREGKGGRGSACIEGFKKALEDNAEYIFEMDADFSHNPKDIPKFLEKIKECDVVIGSRYLRGSQIVNWGWKRTIFSKLANFYAETILRLKISDYTSGYRCYKRGVLESLSFDEIDATGYIVLSEMAQKIFYKGFEIAEIPITFVNRRRGESNLSLNEIVSAFTSVIKLWWKGRKLKKS